MSTTGTGPAESSKNCRQEGWPRNLSCGPCRLWVARWLWGRAQRPVGKSAARAWRQRPLRP
eukprot:6990013-Lingulodinium_polyedra.AAC.1